MQGLPSQLLTKSSKSIAYSDKNVSSKVEAGESEIFEGSQSVASPKIDKSGFASLFAVLTNEDTGEQKSPNSKDENTEIIKNLFSDKEPSQNILATSGPKSELKSEHQIEKKIDKTSINLDQLLNKLKGTQDPSTIEESRENQKSIFTKTTDSKITEESTKGAHKLESPLDFLIKGAKDNSGSSIGKNEVDTSLDKEIETPFAQKKVMTGEDYLKNMESSEKKGPIKQVLLNSLNDLQKNNTQNVKGYGQGLSLLSDPLIKNTKDLAFKDNKISKKGDIAIEELRTPDTKKGVELSAIKQDVIPEMQTNKVNHGQSSETQTQTNQKVLDLGKINTANTNEIIKKISDYVEQNQIANKSSLDLTVKHESLGEFKIQVTKMPNQSMNQAQNLVDMQITTSSKEGQDFFVKNEVSLMKNLNQAGINLSDLRIITTMSESNSFGQSDSRQSSSFGQNPNGTEKQFMSFESNSFSNSGDPKNGSERRKELWEEYQQRYGA